MCLGRLRTGSPSPTGACLPGLGVPNGCSTRCMIGRARWAALRLLTTGHRAVRVRRAARRGCGSVGRGSTRAGLRRGRWRTITGRGGCAARGRACRGSRAAGAFVERARRGGAADGRGRILGSADRRGGRRLRWNGGPLPASAHVSVWAQLGGQSDPVWAVRARARGPLGAAAVGARWRDRGAQAVGGA